MHSKNGKISKGTTAVENNIVFPEHSEHFLLLLFSEASLIFFFGLWSWSLAPIVAWLFWMWYDSRNGQHQGFLWTTHFILGVIKSVQYAQLTNERAASPADHRRESYWISPKASCFRALNWAPFHIKALLSACFSRTHVFGKEWPLLRNEHRWSNLPCMALPIPLVYVQPGPDLTQPWLSDEITWRGAET